MLLESSSVQLAQISVIVPTLNCRRLLEPAMPILRQWMPEAGEIIVVDSFSSDGTLELLRETLDFPTVRFLQRPPGLYAAWNHGISQATREFCYISTAGDAITRAEISHLLDQALQTGVDAVVAPPRFVDAVGAPVTDVRWPIHDLLDRIAPDETIELSGAGLAALSLAHADPIRQVYKSWLGSSASNLYRTAALQRRPFPEDAGNSGDTLFGMENALGLRVLFARGPVGQFVVHCQASHNTHAEALVIESRLAQAFRACYANLLRAIALGSSSLPLIGSEFLASHQATLLDRAAELQEALEHEHQAVLAEMEKKNTARSEIESLQSDLRLAESNIQTQAAILARARNRVPKWLHRTFGLQFEKPAARNPASPGQGPVRP